MTDTQVRGITGLLDGILSAGRPTTVRRRKAKTPKQTTRVKPQALPKAIRGPTPVRRGRPPGPSAATVPKKKLTV